MVNFVKQILFESIQLHLINKDNSLKITSVQASCFRVCIFVVEIHESSLIIRSPFTNFFSDIHLFQPSQLSFLLFFFPISYVKAIRTQGYTLVPSVTSCVLGYYSSAQSCESKNP